MALLTLLDIIQAASGELGLPVPQTIIGNASNNATQARQMLAMANAAGRSLVRVHDWSPLLTLATITTVADQSDYALPAGFDRMVSDTFWDEAERKRVAGPDIPQYDRARRSSNIGQVGILKIFRQIGKTYVRIYPTPTVSDQALTYEYVSNLWVSPSAGTNTNIFAADDDTPLFDADLMVKEVKWRFMSAKGMDTTIHMADWRATLDQLIAADLGGSVLNMGPCPADEADFDVVAGTAGSFLTTDSGEALEID